MAISSGNWPRMIECEKISRQWQRELRKDHWRADCLTFFANLLMANRTGHRFPISRSQVTPRFLFVQPAAVVININCRLSSDRHVHFRPAPERMLQWISLFLAVIVREVCGSCATKEFMPCVVQLNTQRVPFDTNIMHVIYNITTEAKLIHTCRAYERSFPCFAQRLISCGTKAQKTMMERGKRLHAYLCVPFSLQRQKIFLKSSQCIQSLLKLPIDSQCEKPESLMTQKLHSCRSKCGDDLTCNTKTDISELAACSYLRIEKVCGIEAAQLYAQMQQVISNREYPVQCSYTLRGFTRVQPPTPVAQTTVSTTSVTQKPNQELKKKTTLPYYFSTSYITVYPENYVRSNGISRKEPMSRVRTRNFSKLFTPMKNPEILPGASVVTASLETKSFSFTMPQFTSPVPLQTMTTPIPTRPVTTGFTVSLPGARPIPETVLYVQRVASTPPMRNRFPAKIFSASSADSDKFIPWYHNNKESGSAPTNPMIAPFMDVGVHPTLMPPILSNDFPDVPTIGEDVTPPPFKININWHDAPEENVWYQQTVPQQKKLEPHKSGAFEMVTPILNHLKSQPLNFTEMSNQASNYFNAALSALESVADESRSATLDNNPWRTFIDAVAPTIHKVSPNIIPRIRQEMERIESQGA